MKPALRVLAAAGPLLIVLSIGEAAFAQKQGGILNCPTSTAWRACRCTRKLRPPPIGR
jgi:hypothetical protein